MHHEPASEPTSVGFFRRAWRAVTLPDIAAVLFIVFVLVMIGLRQPTEVLNDFWYHAAIGHWVAEHLSIPLWDQISFQPIGRPHLYPPLLHLLYAVVERNVSAPETTFIVMRELLIGFTLVASWWAARSLISPSIGLLALVAVAVDRITLIVSWSLMPSAIIALLIPLIALALWRKRPVVAGLLLALIALSHPVLPTVVIVGLVIATIVLPQQRRMLLTTIGIGAVPWVILGARFLWYLPQLAANYGYGLTEGGKTGIGHFAYATHYAGGLILFPLVVFGVATLLLPRAKLAARLIALSTALAMMLIAIPDVLARGGVFLRLYRPGVWPEGEPLSIALGSALMVVTVAAFLGAAVWRIAPVASRAWALTSASVVTLSLLGGGGVVFARELLGFSAGVLVALAVVLIACSIPLTLLLARWVQRHPAAQPLALWQVVLISIMLPFLATLLFYGGRATWHIMPLLAILALSQFIPTSLTDEGLPRIVVQSLDEPLASYRGRYGALASIILPVQVIGLAVIVAFLAGNSQPYAVFTGDGDRKITMEPAFFLQRGDPKSPEFHRVPDLPAMLEFLKTYAPPGTVIHTNSAETGHMLSIFAGTTSDTGMFWETKTRGLDDALRAIQEQGTGVYLFVNELPEYMKETKIQGVISPWFYAVGR